MSRNRRRNKNQRQPERDLTKVPSSSTEKPKTPEIHKKTDTTFRKSEWTHPAVVAQTLTALVSVVLAVLVIIQIRDARNTFQTSQRAWVLVKEFEWNEFDAETRTISAKITVQNQGQSPGTALRIQHGIQVWTKNQEATSLPPPTAPMIIAVIPPPGISVSEQFTGVIGPGLEERRIAHTVIDGGQFASVSAGLNIRLNGNVVYDDIFGSRRITGFCYEALLDGNAPTPRSTGLCAMGNSV